MSRTLLASAPACLALIVIAASCSGPDSGAAEVAEPTTHTIEIRRMAFHPAELRVRAGDTVVWMNRDVVPHNIADPAAWTSPTLDEGERWELVVEDSGALDYICNLHPVMEGRLIVEATSLPAERR